MLTLTAILVSTTAVLFANGHDNRPEIDKESIHIVEGSGKVLQKKFVVDKETIHLVPGSARKLDGFDLESVEPEGEETG